MVGLASYNLIDRKLNINDPFHFFSELKYQSVESVSENLKRVIQSSNIDELYEEILKTASKNLSDYSDLISNEKNIYSLHYLNNLDMCLRSLVSGKYIECNYRTKFNAHKEILDMKIVSLTILDKGKKSLHDLEILKELNVDTILDKYIAACSLYVMDLNILDLSRDELIDNFSKIFSSISDLNIIEFDNSKDRGIVFNYYEGRFEVTNFNKFKKFVNDNNNFQLENILKESFHDSTIRVMELKIMINALKAKDLDSVYVFMDEDRLIANISYLCNMEYVKLDYSFSNIALFQNSYDIKIHASVITKLGEEFYNNNSVQRMKDLRFSVTDCVRYFKIGIKQKDYKNYFSNIYTLKDVLVFK